MNLLISGYSSEISSRLLCALKDTHPDLKVIKIGRDSSADYFCDFSNFESVRLFTDDLLCDIELDWVFLNHGILLGKKALELSQQDISDYMMVNLYSFIVILEKLCSRENLHSVVMSSISAKEGSYDSIYAATKAGVDTFRYQASKTLPHSSRLNFVSPGIISDARMTTSRKDVDNVELARVKTPSSSLSSSEEVASLVSMLLTNPRNINLQDFAINGGASLNR